jgi:hypothetical protein
MSEEPDPESCEQAHRNSVREREHRRGHEQVQGAKTQQASNDEPENAREGDWNGRPWSVNGVRWIRL